MNEVNSTQLPKTNQGEQSERINRYWGFCLPEGAAQQWREQFRLGKEMKDKEALTDWSETS